MDVCLPSRVKLQAVMRPPDEGSKEKAGSKRSSL